MKKKEAKEKTETYYIVSKFPKESGLKNDKPVEVLTCSTKDKSYEREGLSFEEYVDECIEDYCGNIEQHGGACIVLTEKEFKLVQSFKIK